MAEGAQPPSRETPARGGHSSRLAVEVTDVQPGSFQIEFRT
jgi:hypothetical protein